MTDIVNHPPHYSDHWLFLGSCIDYTRYSGFCQGNAMKYLWRFEAKGKPVEDLRKALWYINKLESGRKIPAPQLRKLEEALVNMPEQVGLQAAHPRVEVAAALFFAAEGKRTEAQICMEDAMIQAEDWYGV